MRESSTILAIDQGTTSTKVLLVDAATGVVLSSCSVPVGINYPQPGWVEQDAAAIWAGIVAAIVQVLDAAPGVTPAGLAISNQRESVIVWSATTGEPVGPMIGWQDARSAAWCADLPPAAATLVTDRTGLPLDAMFSAPKLRWLLNSALAAEHDVVDLRVGTVDSWLIYRLTGNHVIEVGNASRTLLLDTAAIGWDPALADLFEVPVSVLPKVVPSDGPFGTVCPGVDSRLAGVPVLAVLADSHAALYHHGRGAPGVGKATYGTGSSVMVPLAARSPGATLAWQIDGAIQYAAEGNILTSGAGLDWLARTLGLPDGVSGGAFLSDLAEEAADSGGVSFVPAFTGLSAPHWDRDAVGLLTGLTGGTTRAHLARAGLEAVSHQVADVIEALVTTDSTEEVPLERLVADGGASASAALMQVQADLLGREVVVSASPHASAFGAADLAAYVLDKSAGLDRLDRLDRLARLDRRTEFRATFTPSLNDDERVRRRTTWEAAIRRSRSLPT